MAENIKVLLRALKEDDEVGRIVAAQTLALLNTSSAEIVRALEYAAVSDPSEAVREAALAVLAAPTHRRVSMLDNTGPGKGSSLSSCLIFAVIVGICANAGLLIIALLYSQVNPQPGVARAKVLIAGILFGILALYGLRNIPPKATKVSHAILIIAVLILVTICMVYFLSWAIVCAPGGCIGDE